MSEKLFDYPKARWIGTIPPHRASGEMGIFLLVGDGKMRFRMHRDEARHLAESILSYVNKAGGAVPSVGAPLEWESS